MLDKILIIIMISVVFVGFGAFDYYSGTPGEFTRIMGIIDMAGISRFLQQEEVTEKHYQTRYHADLENNIKRLQSIHNQIEQQREALLTNRARILSRLEDITQRTNHEAEKFLAVIREEQSRVLSNYPDVPTIGEQLFDALQNLPPDERKERFALLDSKLRSFVKEITYVDTESSNKLFEEFFQLKNILLEDSSVVGARCPETSSECTAQYFKEVEGAFTRKLNTIIENPIKDHEKLLDLSKRLENEIKFGKENYDASEKRIFDNAQKLDSELQKMLAELGEVDDEDIIKLMDLYKQLLEEQTVLLDNLDLYKSRLYVADSEFGEQLLYLWDRLINVPSMVCQKLARLYKIFGDEQRELVKTFDANERMVRDMYSSRTQYDTSLLQNMVNRTEAELTRLMEARKDQEEYSKIAARRNRLRKTWDDKYQERSGGGRGEMLLFDREPVSIKDKIQKGKQTLVDRQRNLSEQRRTQETLMDSKKNLVDDVLNRGITGGVLGPTPIR